MKFERSVAFYDWQTGNQAKIISGNLKDMDFISLTPQIGYMVTDNSSLQKFQLSLWDTESGVIEKNFDVNSHISGVDVSGDGHWLASAYYTNKNVGEYYVTIWEATGLSGIDDSEWRPDILSSKITLNNDKPIIHSDQRHTVAVMYFDFNMVDEAIARAATVLLESQLANSPSIQLLERNRIDKILEELDLQQSGLTESQVIEIGKLAKADFILVGSVGKLDNDIYVTARLVNIENGTIEGIREAKCTNASTSSIYDMVKVLAPAIAYIDM